MRIGGGWWFNGVARSRGDCLRDSTFLTTYNMYYVNRIQQRLWRIPSARRFFRVLLLCLVALSMPRRAEGQSGPAFIGRVVADSSETPIPGATVALPGLGLLVRADSAGRFTFPSRLSTRGVLVRVVAIGYAPIEEALELPEGDTVSVEFVMSRTAQLVNTVRVVARPLDRTLREFERRRAERAGVFFDEESIKRMARSGRLSNLIRASPGLSLATPARGTVGTEQYVIGGRGSELGFGGSRACYSGVVLDGVWVYSGQSGEPRFNINSVAAETVKAVEVYRSTAQIPVEFNRLGNYCGLVVIWLK